MTTTATVRARATLFGVALSFSCAGTDDAPRAAAVDVAAIDVPAGLSDEVVALTADMIRARAVNPPGGEARVVDVAAARLQRAGIAVDVRPFDGTDRTNLLAVLPGADRALPPFILLGHTDVVPAEEARWRVGAGPFDGAIVDGALVGRGALDMLSMDALQVATMVALHESGVRRARDVVLLLTGDEEVDGRGVQAALDAWPDVLRAGASALTEGGFLFDSFLRRGEDIAAVAVAEKGLFQFRLRATGPTGHGSTPLPDAAPERVVRAAARVLAAAPDLRVSTPTARMFAALGAARGGVEGAVLGNPALLLGVAGGRLSSSPTMRALLADTCALTMLSAGTKENVIPGAATATFDCRLLPGTDPARFRDQLLVHVDDPKVAIEPLTVSPANGSPPDHVVVDAIRGRMKRELPAVVVAPILTRGATDARFLRARGIATYGFVPVRITSEELDTLHGDDERVRVEELKKGLSRLVDVTATVAAR